MSDNFNINSGAELVLRKSLFFNYLTLFDLETTLNITQITTTLPQGQYLYFYTYEIRMFAIAAKKH